MELEQLMFNEIIIEADGLQRAAQDELRTDVELWFDQLPVRQKDALGAWIDSTMQYDALVALSAAAGDWHRSRLHELSRLLRKQ